MSLARLEGELLKAKEEMGKLRKANDSFEKVLQEMSILKSRSVANPETKEQIMQEFRSKELLDLFASIENDFDELRQKMAKQNTEKKQISDFVESIRTRKTFTFSEMEQVLAFLEGAVDALEATHIAVKPEFIGMIDLGGLAVEHGLMRNNQGVIVERERFSEFLVALIAKKMFHDVVLETDNARILLKNSHEIVVESENANIRALNRKMKALVAQN